MKGNSSKGNPLIAAISKRLRRIRGDRLAAIQGRINSRKTLEKVEKHLARWVRDGKHHECYDSMEEILDELDLTNQELSFYCSRILNKKFLTWRKEIRIEDAKKLLLEHPEAPHWLCRGFQRQIQLQTAVQGSSRMHAYRMAGVET